MIVPQAVEEKIRYLIRKFPSTEWSGILFYTYQGTFEDNNLVITCQDIYPMDLGTSGWTEFRISEEVTAYMAENIELFDCAIGLIHSHHAMGAFFSGQDNQTLQQEGDDTNCFVSLIVDTQGTYKARITRKVHTKSEIIVKNLGTSYEFFGEGAKSLSSKTSEDTKIIDKEIIEYFNLEVERQVVQNSLAYLDTRFDEIQKNKRNTEAAKIKELSFYGKDKNQNILISNILKEEKKEKDDFSWGNISLKDEPQKKKHQPILEYENIEWYPDPKKIHEAVVHVLTCSLILNPAKFDMKQWITKHMTKVYDSIFTTKAASLYELDSFSEWREFIIQFTLDHFDVSDVPQNILDEIELLQSRVAEAMYAELEEFIESNPYIASYCEELYKYII